MNEKDEMKKYNYRIINWDETYYVEKKYYNENDKTIYWEKMTHWIFDEPFNCLVINVYSSIEEAEKSIDDDKDKKIPQKVIKYL